LRPTDELEPRITEKTRQQKTRWLPQVVRGGWRKSDNLLALGAGAFVADALEIDEATSRRLTCSARIKLKRFRASALHFRKGRGRF